MGNIHRPNQPCVKCRENCRREHILECSGANDFLFQRISKNIRNSFIVERDHLFINYCIRFATQIVTVPIRDAELNIIYPPIHPPKKLVKIARRILFLVFKALCMIRVNCFGWVRDSITGLPIYPGKQKHTVPMPPMPEEIEAFKNNLEALASSNATSTNGTYRRQARRRGPHRVRHITTVTDRRELTDDQQFDEILETIELFASIPKKSLPAKPSTKRKRRKTVVELPSTKQNRRKLVVVLPLTPVTAKRRRSLRIQHLSAYEDRDVASNLQACPPKFPRTGQG